MGADTVEEQLVNYLEDAHALEQHVDKALERMIAAVEEFPELRDPLTHHKKETERHKRLLEERLEAHGASPSRVKDAGMIIAALGKGAVDTAREDNTGKVARDGFAVEHLEIAAYELLERMAGLAGDQETMEVARRNRADEVAMAEKIESHWDLALGLSLKQAGIEGAHPVGFREYYPPGDEPIGQPEHVYTPTGREHFAQPGPGDTA